MRVVLVEPPSVLLPVLEHLLADRIILERTFSPLADRVDHLCVLVGLVAAELLLHEFFWRSKNVLSVRLAATNSSKAGRGMKLLVSDSFISSLTVQLPIMQICVRLRKQHVTMFKLVLRRGTSVINTVFSGEVVQRLSDKRSAIN